MSRIIMPPTILLNAVNFGPSSVKAANGGVIDLLPWHDWTWAEEITFTITASAANGVPTSGALTPKFQLGIPFVSGNQFSTNRLFDLESDQVSKLIVEGTDWPTIAYNASFPKTVQRTIRNFGARCNLRLTSDLAGGTNPTHTITVVMSAKGR